MKLCCCFMRRKIGKIQFRAKNCSLSNGPIIGRCTVQHVSGVCTVPQYRVFKIFYLCSLFNGSDALLFQVVLSNASLIEL